MGQDSRVAWTIWVVGVFAYAVAIMHRTSLGSLGIASAEHFHTSVSAISTFVMVQLAVYALAQAPVGVLIDRYGSRAMLLVGSVVMAGAQTAMAFTDTFALALAARVFVGIGDACMFGSVLRLVPVWFSPGRVPILSQLTGLLGQFGQVWSVALLLPLFELHGWAATFLTAAGLSVAALVATVFLVHDVPVGQARAKPQGEHIRDLPRGVIEAWRHPATRLGFWIHLTSGFSVNVFAMIWGIPWLVQSQGRTQAEAAFLFSLTVFGSMGVAPVMGWLTARHPLRRSNLALTVIIASAASWTLALIWPGPAPWWLLVVLTLALAAAGPGTGIGFDFPRTLLPPHRLGAANGLVIAGSFTGATVCLLAIGALLAWLAPDGHYTPAQLDLAMALQFPFFATGIAGLFITRTKLRRKMRAHGVVVPTWPEVVRRLRHREPQRPPGNASHAAPEEQFQRDL